MRRLLLIIGFVSCRTWDLNKICYKSGIPVMETAKMIERVSTGGGLCCVNECFVLLL